MKKRALILSCVFLLLLSAFAMAACNDNTKKEYDYASDPIIGTYTMEYKSPYTYGEVALYYITVTSCKAEDPEYQYPTHFRCNILYAELYELGGTIFEPEITYEIRYNEKEEIILFDLERQVYKVLNYHSLTNESNYYGRWDDGILSADKETVTFTEYDRPGAVGNNSGEVVGTRILSRTSLTEPGFKDYCEARFGV